jgi:hypothetical protein
MMTNDEALVLRQQCVDLLFDCPHKRSEAACLFRQVRTWAVVERVTWLKEQPLTQLRYLVSSHAACGRAAGGGCKNEGCSQVGAQR